MPALQRTQSTFRMPSGITRDLTIQEVLEIEIVLPGPSAPSQPNPNQTQTPGPRVPPYIVLSYGEQRKIYGRERLTGLDYDEVVQLFDRDFSIPPRPPGSSKHALAVTFFRPQSQSRSRHPRTRPQAHSSPSLPGPGSSPTNGGRGGKGEGTTNGGYDYDDEYDTPPISIDHESWAELLNDVLRIDVTPPPPLPPPSEPKRWPPVYILKLSGLFVISLWASAVAMGY